MKSRQLVINPHSTIAHSLSNIFWIRLQELIIWKYQIARFVLMIISRKFTALRKCMCTHPNSISKINSMNSLDHSCNHVNILFLKLLVYIIYRFRSSAVINTDLTKISASSTYNWYNFSWEPVQISSRQISALIIFPGDISENHWRLHVAATFKRSTQICWCQYRMSAAIMINVAVSHNDKN